MSNPRAICGSCGKSRNEHHKERQGNDYAWYCYHADTGYQDEFSDEPTNETIVAYLRAKDPVMMESVISEWKELHGHHEKDKP